MSTQTTKSPGKPFSVHYTNSAGERVLERPRLVLTADGRHKALFLGNAPLATIPIDAPDTDLWEFARAVIHKR